MRDPDHMRVLQKESLDWIDRMTSGLATNSDAAALVQWRSQSPQHAAAFSRAMALRDGVQEFSRLHALEQTISQKRAHVMGRRLLLGGGFAVFAGAAAFAAVKPPLGLWPSLAEMNADFRTGKGEKRQIAFGDHVSVQMNTASSLSKRDTAQGHGIDLVEGEVAVTVRSAASFRVYLGNITATIRPGTTNLRFDDAAHAVLTALDGAATIALPDRVVQLRPRQQLRVGGTNAAHPVFVDTDPVLAWRDDLLLLRNASLQDAVKEINRYRPGRVVIANSSLSTHRVNAVLQLNDIERSVEMICRLTGAHATALGEYIILT